MFPICLLLRWAINKIDLIFITRQKDSSSPCFALKSMLTTLLCSFHNSAIETSSSHNTQSYTTQLCFSQKGIDARQGKQWWISQSEWLLQMPSVGLVCSCLVPDSWWEKAERLLLPGSQGPDGEGLALWCLVCISKASCQGWPVTIFKNWLSLEKRVKNGKTSRRIICCANE